MPYKYDDSDKDKKMADRNQRIENETAQRHEDEQPSEIKWGIVAAIVIVALAIAVLATQTGVREHDTPRPSPVTETAPPAN
jgi:hypothetical protein